MDQAFHGFKRFGECRAVRVWPGIQGSLLFVQDTSRACIKGARVTIGSWSSNGRRVRYCGGEDGRSYSVNGPCMIALELAEGLNEFPEEMSAIADGARSLS